MTRYIAFKANLQVVRCVPCMEAMLLAMHSDVQEAKSTAVYQQAFEKRFGKPANETASCAKPFSKETPGKACVQSPEPDALLVLLTLANGVSP